MTKDTALDLLLLTYDFSIADGSKPTRAAGYGSRPIVHPFDLLAEYLPAYEAAQAQAADLIWHALSHGQPPDRIHYPRIDYWTRDAAV